MLMPQGERRPVAQGSILPSSKIRSAHPLHGTKLVPDHHTSPNPKFNVTKKEPSGAIFGP